MTISELLKKQNMTKYRLSKLSDVPYSTLNDPCSGKTSLERCSAETVYRLAKELHVSMEVLLAPCFEKRCSFELFKSNVCHKLKRLSDIVGILAEHAHVGNLIDHSQIETAVQNLYGGWDGFSSDAISFLQDILRDRQYLTIYDRIRQGELRAKEILLDFQQAYPGLMREDNVDGILESKIGTETTASVLEQLNALRKQREGQPEGEAASESRKL